jgi:hypothetical protein
MQAQMGETVTMRPAAPARAPAAPAVHRTAADWADTQLWFPETQVDELGAEEQEADGSDSGSYETHISVLSDDEARSHGISWVCVF